MGTGWWRVVLAALLSLTSASAQTVNVYHVLGRDLNLDLASPVAGAIQSVLWTHNGNLAAEVEGNVSTYFSIFLDGDAVLDPKTANLKIPSADKRFYGTYRVDVNARKQDQIYLVKSIDVLTTARLEITSLTCSKQSKSCQLVCHGATKGSDPVTYSWKPSILGNTSEVVLENNDHMTQVKSISCKIKNPVSQVESQDLDNPFYHPQLNPWGIVGSVVGVAVVVTAASVGFWKRELIKNRFPCSNKNTVL